MQPKLNSMINKYRLLPAFMQRRVTKSIIDQISEETKNNPNTNHATIDEKGMYIRELFKASKAEVRAEYLDTFEDSCRQRVSGFSARSIPYAPGSIITVLGKREQFKLFTNPNMTGKKIEYFWSYIKEENKARILSTSLSKIKYSKEPNIEKYDIASLISMWTDSDSLQPYAEEIFQTFATFDYKEYERECVTSPKEDRETDNKTGVIYKAVLPIWDSLTKDQRNEIIPKLIDEYENGQDYSADIFGVFLKDFSPEIQAMYFERIFRKIQERVKTSENSKEEINRIKLEEFWKQIPPEVQLLKFDEVVAFAQSLSGDTKVVTFIWENTSPDVQKEKYDTILTDELRREDSYQYWTLYRGSNIELQHTLLESLFESTIFSGGSKLDLDRLLSVISPEACEGIFQQLFEKANGDSKYIDLLLSKFPGYIKNENSVVISEYLSANLESYLTVGKLEKLVAASQYLEMDSLKNLMNKIIDFSNEKPDFLNDLFEVSSYSEIILPFFNRMDLEDKKDTLNTLLESKNLVIFKSLFNAIDIDSDKEKLDLVKLYLEKKGLEEDTIDCRIDTFKRLHEKNIELSKTIDLEFFSTDIVTELTQEQLLRITHYPEAQESLLKFSDNKAFIKMFGFLTETPENWTIMAEKVFTSVGEHHFDLLLKNIADKELSEDDAKNLIEILSTKNYFGISTYEDVKEFQSTNGKKNKTIMQIFNGDYDNLPSEIKKEFQSEEDLKRFALSEYLLNIPPNEIEHMAQNYGEGIKGIAKAENNPEFNAELDDIRRYLGICEFLKNANKEELNNLIAYVTDPEKKITKYTVMDIESRIVNVFAKSIENDLYKVKDHLEDFSFTDTYDDRGTIKTISVHRMQEDFNALVRVEGAYVNFTPPEDFKEYFEVPNVENHGNCESIIGNALIAPAREKDNSIVVGYSTIPKNALLLMGPDDLISAMSNKKLAPVNHQPNCAFYSVEEEINKTRHTHNEVVKERLIVSPDGSVEKLLPSYIVWFEEEIDEKCPPDENNTVKHNKWQTTKQAAAQMDLPIVVINREYYAQRETKKMHDLESMIRGDVTLPEDKKLSEVMESLFLVMENNSNSLRFSKKIKGKYFTQEDRERINILIQDKIEELAKTDPKLAYECLQKILPRCEYEKEASKEEMEEDRVQISQYYASRTSVLGEFKLQLEAHLEMDSGLDVVITEQRKLDTLFKSYSESEVTVADVQSAGHVIEGDVKKHNRVFAKTQMNPVEGNIGVDIDDN